MQTLTKVDLYRYDESWERSPVVLFTHFYETPRSLTQSLLNNLSLRPQSCVLDLRTAADFSTWHLPGSVNIPIHSLDFHTPKPFSNPRVLETQWRELEAMFSDEMALFRLQGHHVLVICYHGDTARVATSVLRAKGIEADSLRGGYQALRDHGLWGDNHSSSSSSSSSSSDVGVVEKQRVSVTAVPVQSD